MAGPVRKLREKVGRALLGNVQMDWHANDLQQQWIQEDENWWCQWLAALLSAQSSGSKEPNRKCCMIGSLDNTSTWYILIMPLFTCSYLASSNLPDSHPAQHL